MAEKNGGNGNIGSRVGAGTAGAGSGTMLVFLANSLPPDNPAKPWLIWLAPTVSTFMGFFLLWVINELIEMVVERKFKSLVKKIKKNFQDILDNKNTSEEQREAILKKYEELNNLTADRNLEKLKQFSKTQEPTSN